MLNVDAVGIDAGVDTRAGGLQRLAGDRALRGCSLVRGIFRLAYLYRLCTLQCSSRPVVFHRVAEGSSHFVAPRGPFPPDVHAGNVTA